MDLLLCIKIGAKFAKPALPQGSFNSIALAILHKASKNNRLMILMGSREI
jgi:hypothetical protein